MKFNIFISPDGTCRAVYSDSVRKLMPGPVEVERVSSVEFDHGNQRWQAVNTQGELITIGSDREVCLARERKIVEANLRKLAEGEKQTLQPIQP